MRALADLLVPDWALGLVGFVPSGAVPCEGGCAFHPSRLRHLSVATASPETDPAGQVVDAGINHIKDNGAGGARLAGEAEARASFPRVLP